MKNFSRILFFLFLFYINIFSLKASFAQNLSAIDSLKRILESAQEDSARAKIYNSLSGYLEYSSPENALKYADSALFYGMKGNNTREIAKAYNNIGSIFTQLGNFDSALVYYSSSIENFKKIDYKNGIAALYNNMGKVYSQTGNYLLAIENYQSAIKIFEEINDKEGVASVFNNFSAVFIRQNKYSEAIEYLQKSFAIYNEIGDYYGAAASLTNIGTIYEERKEFEQALKYYYEALEKNRKIDYKSGIATNLCYIGNVFHLKQDDATSLKFQKEALKIQQDIGNKQGIALILFNIAEIYFELSDKTEAISNFSNSLNMAMEISDKELIKSNYKSLSTLYEDEGDYLQAHKYFKLYSEVKDSILNETINKQISEIQIKYETEKKEKENKLLKQDNEIKELEIEKERSFRNSLITGLIALVVFFAGMSYFFLLIRRKNLLLNTQQKELIVTNNKLVESENNLLDALATKNKFFSIISHDLRGPFISISSYNDFLKENIHSIPKEELIQLTNEFNNVVVRINNLLENLLLWAKTQTGRIQVKKEILSLKNALSGNLQLFTTIAADKKIEVQCCMNENVMIHFDKYMLDAVIRNLLSNAIKYTSENGKVSVHAIENGNEIIIEVRDTGTGINSSDLKKIFNMNRGYVKEGTSGDKGSGLGLILCKEFVELNNGSIWVESEFGKGTAFKFSVPVA